MSKEITRDYLSCVQRLNDTLPEEAEIFDISLSDTCPESNYVALFGIFDFRTFAEAHGAVVKNECREDDEGKTYIRQEARLCGCTVSKCVHPYDPLFERELRRCELQ